MRSFQSSIRSKDHSFRFGRDFQVRRAFLFVGILFFICLIASSNRKENCWLDYYRSRLFCFVITNQSHLETRSRAVYQTWGRRCGRFVLIARSNSSRSYTILDHEDPKLEKDQLPIQYIPTLPEENYRIYSI